MECLKVCVLYVYDTVQEMFDCQSFTSGNLSISTTLFVMFVHIHMAECTGNVYEVQHKQKYNAYINVLRQCHRYVTGLSQPAAHRDQFCYWKTNHLKKKYIYMKVSLCFYHRNIEHEKASSYSWMVRTDTT